MKPRRSFALAVASPLAPRPRWTRPAPVAPPLDPAERERRTRLLTMPEAADYLRYTGPAAAHSAYNFIKRHDLPIIKRGKTTLVRLGVLDDYLESQRRDIAGRAQALLTGRR